jgi:hypothetical protein
MHRSKVLRRLTQAWPRERAGGSMEDVTSMHKRMSTSSTHARSNKLEDENDLDAAGASRPRCM